MNESKFNNLIVKHYSGDITREEEIELKNWIAASQANHSYFEKITNLLKKTYPLKKPVVPDIEIEWDKLAHTLELDDEKETSIILPLKQEKATSRKLTKSIMIKWQPYAIAASFFLIVLAGALWLNYQAATGMLVVETRNSETKKLNLPDGTIVTMNSATKIEYLNSFSDSIRQVSLAGEAFFNVVSEGRKFIVLTDNDRLSVLGTKFNIWTRNNVTRVIVEEGRVSFGHTGSDLDEGLILTANQMAVSENKQIGQAIDLTDTQVLLGWLTGKIVFNKTGLQEVVEELNRIYDLKIKLEDKKLANLSITGSFEKKPINDILEAICLTLELQYRLETDTYVIF